MSARSPPHNAATLRLLIFRFAARNNISFAGYLLNTRRTMGKLSVDEEVEEIDESAEEDAESAETSPQKVSCPRKSLGQQQRLLQKGPKFWGEVLSTAVASIKNGQRVFEKLIVVCATPGGVFYFAIVAVVVYSTWLLTGAWLVVDCCCCCMFVFHCESSFPCFLNACSSKYPIPEGVGDILEAVGSYILNDGIIVCGADVNLDYLRIGHDRILDFAQARKLGFVWRMVCEGEGFASLPLRAAQRNTSHVSKCELNPTMLQAQVDQAIAKQAAPIAQAPAGQDVWDTCAKSLKHLWLGDTIAEDGRYLTGPSLDVFAASVDANPEGALREAVR